MLIPHLQVRERAGLAEGQTGLLSSYIHNCPDAIKPAKELVWSQITTEIGENQVR